MEFLWRPWRGLSIGLLGAYTDAKLTSDATALGGMRITEYANSGGQNETGIAAFIQPRTIGIELGAKF